MEEYMFWRSGAGIYENTATQQELCYIPQVKTTSRKRSVYHCTSNSLVRRENIELYCSLNILLN